MTVEGDDGRRYLDCLCGAGTLALGHNHPVVVKAIQRTLDSGTPLHVLHLATVEKGDFTSALFDTKCLDYISNVWTDMRPKSLIEAERNKGIVRKSGTTK
jgi:4-aminobutyrate aminotransferase-like enzyme